MHTSPIENCNMLIDSLDLHKSKIQCIKNSELH